ncbi:MAG: carboxypeptidase-like regulatory domain-containing protein, partial [Opitutus sp.]|nr:carboxypeptidase-like regulatory domain-containing protein [Opitutus sp.]
MTNICRLLPVLPRRYGRRLFLAVLFPAMSLFLPAQPIGGAGAIAGRVFNPVAKEYVFNAEVRLEGTNRVTFTGTDGSYRLPNVPEGPARVTVHYTGYANATATVAVEAGRQALQNFDLVSTETDERGPLKMDAFTVATQREGNAQAIMDQRASLN